MKRITLLLLACAALLSGCKSEKKVSYYSDIFNEKPVNIYIAPVDDQTERRTVKYPKDAEWNNELNTAAKHLYQTMAAPLVNHGYYVPGPVACQEIGNVLGLTPKQMRNAGLNELASRWGIDAVINTTIIKWAEENGKWIVYLEYQMRSTKTNTDLMHKWVKAVKEVPTNLKGDPVILQQDKAYAKRMNFDNGTAQRCFLVEMVNDYVMRNVPISSTRRQFEDDLYKRSTDTYILFTWTEEGKADVQSIGIEQFEQEAFI